MYIAEKLLNVLLNTHKSNQAIFINTNVVFFVFHFLTPCTCIKILIKPVAVWSAYHIYLFAFKQCVTNAY